MKNTAEKITECKKALLFYINQIAEAKEITAEQAKTICKYCNQFLRLDQKAQIISNAQQLDRLTGKR